MKHSFTTNSNSMKMKKTFILPLVQIFFRINSLNKKIGLQRWPGIWKSSRPWVAGSFLMFTLPFPADNHWPNAHELNDSHPQLIINNDKHLSLSRLLADPEKYHQQLIRLRGQVTRLELHLDNTQHFIDFVFFLKDGREKVLVFGRHDRTNGDIQLTSDHMVEVQGRFLKERTANGHRLLNNLEAYQVRFYPPRNPDRAQRLSPHQKHQISS